MMHGQKIRDRRVACGKSQADLARQVGTSRAFISMLEAGRSGASIKTLAGIAKALNCDLSEFLDECHAEIPDESGGE